MSDVWHSYGYHIRGHPPHGVLTELGEVVVEQWASYDGS